ncbi:YpiB family protein [Ectobacillus sp. sgz5001026]|uniref:YpiB family protein n=1 Tax=Ectobacillus sp. sgz5001026 TaxID=3242473 RepID=UPI0036D3A776
MNKWVSVSAKRNFLKWFLDHHRLKRTDARKVLEYMLNAPPILECISFTEQIQLNRKTIVISSAQSDEPGFEFYYNKRKTEDIAIALGELMANPSDRVNVMIHFYGKMSNHSYLQLIESPAIDNLRQYTQYEKDAKEVDVMIKKLMLEQKRQILKQQIDEALDANNKPLFASLVDQLNQLPKI